MKRKDALKLMGMTQKEIADIIGYRTRSTIANWPDELLPIHITMLIGVAVLANREIPKEFLK